MSLLAEIDKATIPAVLAGGEKAGSAFSEVLASVLRRRGR
jgi:hypothetical protein